MDHIEWIARGIAVRDGRVLLCRNVKGEYTYLPGGHVDFGELAAEALRREFQEETGLDVRVGAGVCCIEARFEQVGKRRHEVSVLFHVEREGTEWPPEVPSRESKIAFDWVTQDRLDHVDLRPPAVLALLRAILQDEPVPAYLAEAATPPPPA